MEGTNGAFRAAQCDDIGSPWTNTGPVELRLLKQPDSQTAFPSEEVTFQVGAAGLPRPRYQWWFQRQGHAVWEMIPGAGADTLIFPSVNPNHAGAYRVVLSNGLSTVTSVMATLTIFVPTTCVPVTVSISPQDVEAFPGQTAVFTVTARGYLPPQYQWQSNGVDLASETNATLVVTPVNLDMSGMVYSVRVWNLDPVTFKECSSTNVSARLTVVPRPHLEFTEIHAAPSNTFNKKPWAELTNRGTNAANLRGYRFSDTLPDAFKSFTVIATITNDLILQPGESVILLDSLSSEVFKLWWGERHLPCGLQIFTFGGFSFSASGESLFLWNQAAMDPLDTVATVMWLASTPGVSLEVENICDTNGCVGYAIWDAVCGTNGAFRADQDGDIGSPGYLSNMPPFLTLTAQPVSLTVVRGATATFSVCADGTPERSYQWRKDGVPLAGATNASLIISNAQTADAGGYSVVVTNAADAITSQVATLTVIVPPRITAQPQSLIRRQGNDASFNVQAVGDMELTYQWQFNGINLAGANSHSLCLVCVQRANAGDYRLIITNLAGSVTSSVATLTVLGQLQASEWGHTNGQFRLRLCELATDTNLTIQATSNLTTWFNVLTTNPPTPTFEFAWPMSEKHRFFRARQAK